MRATRFNHVSIHAVDMEESLRRELTHGAAQMYLRDRAGNLVEVGWPDVTTLDRFVVGPIPRLADERPESEAAADARLYL